MINKAITFAVKAHDGQHRKGTTLPYILHPMEVGMIVSRMTDDEDVVAAAILHDTVEDCEEVSVDMICREFGERIAALVERESEDKNLSWEERKNATLQALKAETRREMKLIALGDKLSNIRCIYGDYIRIGDEVWQRFNVRSKEKQGWYYRGLCDALSDLSDMGEYAEFCRLVGLVFGDVAAK
ncbi:MAG: HD domain-containing protein [Eubacteriales bacterium]|nr:HD domain-containing protein [Eubacteriales bacterium]